MVVNSSVFPILLMGSKVARIIVVENGMPV